MGEEYQAKQKCKNCGVRAELMIKKGTSRRVIEQQPCPNCGCYLNGIEIPRVQNNQNRQQNNLSKMEGKIKFWAIALTCAIFGSLVVWRIILKFIN